MDEIIYSLQNPSNPRVTNTDIVIYGKRPLAQGETGSIVFEFDATSPYGDNSISGNASSSTQFQSNQTLFVFVRDDYGNLLWTYNEADITKNYVKIQ